MSALADYKATHFRWEAKGKVATITLDRPERKNPLTFESYAELRDLFGALRQAEDVKVIVLTGSGGNFCSGGDVHDIIGPLTRMDMPGLLRFTTMTGDLVKAMRACPQPIVAGIDGICVGAGAILAMASDIRLGTARSKVGFLFVRVGLAGCDMGACAILPRIIGHGRAAELLYTGRLMEGSEAERWGFYNRLVEPDAVLAEATAFAEALAAGPTFAHGITKRQLHMEWDMPVDMAIDAEAEAQALCMATGDFRRAYDAFVAKAKPVFEGKLSDMDADWLGWPFFEPRHRDLATRLAAWAATHVDEGDHEADVDGACRKLVRDLGEAGWLRHAVPAAYGGVHPAIEGRELCLIRDTLARKDGLADFAFALQGLGTGPISLFGSEEMKRRYLPDVAAGKKIAAFAMTETDAGSDAAAIITTAERDNDSYVLNGHKAMISNGGIADHYVVLARTGEAPGAKGLSAFVVDFETPGFWVAERYKVIAPHPLGRLRFNHCKVPASAMIGKPGDGFKIVMATLDLFRPSVGAAALGFARRALDEGLARAGSRKMFGGTLGDLQLTQARLAEMALDVDAAALLVYRAAWMRDSGAARTTREAAMAKLFATEAAQRVVDGAVQLFGGQGVIAGNVVERLYREVRALRIYEGASEVQKLVIARQIMSR